MLFQTTPTVWDMLKPCIPMDCLNAFNKENRVSKADRSYLFFICGKLLTFAESEKEQVDMRGNWILQSE